MTKHAKFAVFTLVASVVYVMAYNFGWQLFRYYPLINKVTLAAEPKTSGPAMMYYGWISTAALAGLAAALVVPNRFAARLPSSIAWIVPLALIAFTLVAIAVTGMALMGGPFP